MLVRPCGNRVLVKMVQVREVTAGGIYVPEIVKAAERKKRFKVLALGEGRETEDGRIIPITRCAVGDCVLVAPRAVGIDVPNEDDGPQTFVVDVEAIVAVELPNPVLEEEVDPKDVEKAEAAKDQLAS